jgi:NAD(P)-dependent dehydrogenase (short-subunit alcohol dehydrogenase family)
MQFVNELKGKIIVVTGGARRLGKEIVLGAARAGAHVAFTYLNSEEEALRTLAELKAICADVLAVQCDVREQQSIARAMDIVLKHYGRLDILVNNSGKYETVAMADLKPEQWDEIFAVNVRGPFLVSQYCTPALRQSKGKIINLGSLGGEKPWPDHMHYCSSKAALHMLTRTMAKALAPDIAVNCVAPGMIDLEQGRPDPEAFRRFAEHTPMKRNGEASDVVSAALYFASAPQFITGQILLVDGGLALR